MERKKLLSLILALLTAIMLSTAFASVFSYYPAQVSVAPTSPPVYFALGKNAGSSDLGSGNTITVRLGSNNVSAAITVHPTYQVTYYKNVTVIVNSDTKAYNVYIRVTSPITTLPTGSGSAIGTSPTSGMAKLYIYSKGASRSLTEFPTPAPSRSYIAVVDLTTTGTTYVGSLSGGGVYEIDIYIYIPEGASLQSSPLTASIMLIATPSSETLP
uniref:Uncharacterized protein n=1 Tax=Ignisphaera aggregans TaxID=334771 RepID=A0A7J2U4R3_9CREN